MSGGGQVVIIYRGGGGGIGNLEQGVDSRVDIFILSALPPLSQPQHPVTLKASMHAMSRHVNGSP